MAGANSGNNNFNLNGGGNNSADPFEEFEFRPINEGLGFHRKQKNQSGSGPTAQMSSTDSMTTTPAPITSRNMMNSTISSSMNTLISSSAPISTSVMTSSNPFQSPLPRPDARAETRFETRLETRPDHRKANSFQVPTIEDDSIAKAQTAVNEILKNLNQKRQLDFVQETSRLKGESKRSKPHFFAATLDTMLITAAFLMSLILMLSITKVDLFMNLTHPKTSGLVYLASAALFLGITFIYMVVNRTFLGATPGEWAFEQTCGRIQQTDKASYVPRLALRTAVVAITGFITLPILSYLLNKDIAGDISGVSLYKKPNV
ncbi:MAG: metalloendopeptidase [Bdellovibrio sp.]|nr:metalloendopeptidase [Bdellovibrio sp.]